jgi:hypothetical protein
MTDARLLGAGLLDGQPAGTVAVVVRLADPGGLAGVRPGARRPGLHGGPDPPESSGWGALDQGFGGDAAAPAGGGAGGTDGLVLLAVDTSTAARLAAAQGARLLSLTIHDR